MNSPACGEPSAYLKLDTSKMNAFIAAFPRAIERSLLDAKEVNCLLCKATKSSKGVKLMPHGHMRTPVLLGNVQPTDSFIDALSDLSSLSCEEIKAINSQIIGQARSALMKGEGAFFELPTVCRIYVSKGRLRVTSNVKMVTNNDAEH